MPAREARRSIVTSAFPLLLALVLVAPLGFAWWFQQAPLRDPDEGRIIFSPPDPLRPTSVVVDGDSFVVNGTRLGVLKCLRYQPAPPGQHVGHGYRWAHDEGNYVQDLPLLETLGANAVAVSATSGADAPELREFMSRALDHGVYSIIVVDGPNGEDAAVPEVREWFLTRVEDAVRAYADHPGVLAWQLGIEVDYLYPHPDRVEDWYRLVADGAALVEALDPHHPVFTASNPRTKPEAFLAGSPGVPVYGINFYGLTADHMEGYLRDLAENVPGHPILVAEMGVDAWNNVTGSEDEATQARVLADAWRGLEAARDGDAPVLGGCVHEWSDQWWKGPTSSTHDADPQWNATEAGVLPDDAFSEEWFGIVRFADSGAHEPRAAYHALARLWRS